ncbi:hypothetical protein BHM03_00029775 [Ensete ventricosum]|nr:hypothetical protein BHM03_00029775 [Ensete ventricosum]
MSLPERSLCLYAIDGWATNPALVTGVVITMRGQSRRMAHRLAVSMIDAAVAVRTLSGTVACRNRCDHRCCIVIKDRDTKNKSHVTPTSRRRRTK